tara:strand:+ start:1686 stop:2264 length:579 start_codon:yes stop_codon:yes gene_type:complete
MKSYYITGAENLPRRTIIDCVYKAIHPLKLPYGTNALVSFFIDCLAALDSRNGTLFYLVTDEGYICASAFTYKAFSSDKSSPHLHILSVPQKYQGRGYGKEILKLALSQTSEDGNISAECKIDIFPFFKKYGFNLKTTLQHDDFGEMAKIHHGNNPEKNLFFKPILSEEYADQYLKEYIDYQNYIRQQKLSS